MRIPQLRALAVVALGLALLTGGITAAWAGPDTDAAAPTTVDLKHKTERRWAYVLPEERWHAVGEAFDFSAAGGPTFAVAPEGDALGVDRDGDGAVDVRIEGETGLVVFRQKDGPFRYAAQLKNEGAGWVWRATSVRRGEIAGTRVSFIDVDGDGVYGEHGVDAVVVGIGKAASIAGPTLRVGEQLLSVNVAKDGSQVSHKPYAGKTGTLDLRSAFECKAALVHLVLQSRHGNHSFEVAAEEGAITLPFGSYTIHSGSVGLGSMRVEISTGRMEPVKVGPKAPATLTWGGPLKAEFQMQAQGNQVAFSPDHIWYYGQAGEEYRGWTPLGKSPVFDIRDTASGKSLKKAVFPGSG